MPKLPEALTNEGAERDAQPAAGINAALGEAFNTKGEPSPGKGFLTIDEQSKVATQTIVSEDARVLVPVKAAPVPQVRLSHQVEGEIVSVRCYNRGSSHRTAKRFYHRCGRGA